MSGAALFLAVAVTTGSVVESGSGVASVEKMAEEGLGGLAVEFKANWTPEEMRATGEACRRLGMRFRMDELFDRRTGEVKDIYAARVGEMVDVARAYSDVYAGAGLFYETGGVLYYWQQPAVAAARVKIPPVDTFAEAEAHVAAELRRGIARAESLGVPRPYANIEASFGFAPALFKAGYDEVDLEVIYGPDQERCYSGVKTAAEAFGKRRFGVDMAVAWYGGVQHDRLWRARWRTSLLHAFMRGADPIYLEHGLLEFRDHGLDCGIDHPFTRETRAALAELARHARGNPRPDGLPLAAVAAIQGRHDGYIGGFQTHLYGQRTNDLWRLTAADRAWSLFEDLYRRRAWHDRDSSGAADYSGNPPLGMADILPHDAPESLWSRYRTLFFLGRNTMDDALYGRLVAFVRGGGTLILAACHLNVSDRPGGGFVPYNGGDWSVLAGVKVSGSGMWRMPHGVKFSRNPAAGWHLEPHNPDWDPLFPDGGFSVPDLEVSGAVPFGVSSDRFAEGSFDGLKPVIFANRIGSGTVVFLASLDSPGEAGTVRLYRHLLLKAMEATDAWPKVECSDRVRWSVYGDGTIYLLNTEASLRQEAMVRRRPGDAPKAVLLAPGELRALSPGNVD